MSIANRAVSYITNGRLHYGLGNAVNYNMLGTVCLALVVEVVGRMSGGGGVKEPTFMRYDDELIEWKKAQPDTDEEEILAVLIAWTMYRLGE